MSAIASTARIGFALGPAIRQELAHAAAALTDPNRARAVHQGRVRIKRARALARIAIPSIGAPARTFNDAARDVLGALSAARDLDALEACARNLIARAGPMQAVGFAALIRALHVARGDIAEPDLAAAQAGVVALIGQAADWPILNEAAVRAGVTRMARRAGRTFLRAFDTAEEERRHDWRKREKDRAYAIELLGAAWPRGVKRRRRRAKRLAAALGLERDVLLLRAFAKAMPAMEHRTVKPAIRALTRLHRRLAARADRLGEALHRGERIRG
jgi:CHAD domain-containing protein